MTLHKSILPVLLAVSCWTSCQGQRTTDQPKKIPGRSANERLSTYRQIFRDSLPEPTGWTNDYEGLFSDTEEKKLDSIMSAFERETTTQLCIVTLDTVYTSKEKFDELALYIANTWGVGQKEKNNGVTICISKGHKRIRICNGYGIEKILSDQETKEIVDRFFISKFKEGEYFEGTLNGLLAIVETLRLRLRSD